MPEAIQRGQASLMVLSSSFRCVFLAPRGTTLGSDPGTTLGSLRWGHYVGVRSCLLFLQVDAAEKNTFIKRLKVSTLVFAIGA